MLCCSSSPVEVLAGFTYAVLLMVASTTLAGASTEDENLNFKPPQRALGWDVYARDGESGDVLLLSF